MLQVTPTDLKEVLILEYENYLEIRGSSYSNFSMRDLSRNGIDTNFVEENVYCPKKTGTLYGIHFQNNPWPKQNYCIVSKEKD